MSQHRESPAVLPCSCRGFVMLIEFRIANFRSFKEEQTFSLVASKDTTHPENLIPYKFNLLKAAAIYGPNASGKSNLIKAIAFMEKFIRISATRMNQGDEISGINPFRLTSDLRDQPSSFEVDIIIDKTRFKYGFSATRERVYDEWLNAYLPNKKKQRWLERWFDQQTLQTKWVFGGPLKTAGKILRERTRDNGLALSRGAEQNIEHLNRLFLWFRKSLWVFDLSDRPEHLLMQTAMHLKEDQSFRNRIVQMIQHADLSIDEISIVEESFRLPDVDVPQDAPENIKAVLQAFSLAIRETLGDKGLSRLTIQTAHRMHGSSICEQFNFEEEESNGTQRFFALAGPLLDALDKGAIVVVDELDCSMHPLLTRRLIELFQSPELNTKGAQLVFTTHDSTLMDPELFRRDQIWLVEKNRSGASEIFSLYDFDSKDRPRNTEAFQRNYLAGRYGGVPKFGPIFEDLEIK